MGIPSKDRIGKKFGKLTIINVIKNKGKKTYVLCKCDCGNTKQIRLDGITSGLVVSCGCFNKEQAIKTGKKKRTHGKTHTRIYRIWRKMKERCYYEADRRKYKYYGGRGITVYEEWKNSFEKFYDWAITHGYADNLSIDRIDVNGNYEPSNCRWITMAEQQRNKRNNIKIQGA